KICLLYSIIILNRNQSMQKRCFVICPIGRRGSRDRKHSDKVFERIIRPVIKPMGYEAFRADHVPHTGTITKKIIQDLARTELVIADLTFFNPNVFYELAVRHTLRKPAIQMIRDGQKLPFDLANQQTIFFKTTSLGITEAKSNLRAQLKY